MGIWFFRRYMENGLPEIISIWNEVVEEGIEIIKYTGG